MSGGRTAPWAGLRGGRIGGDQSTADPGAGARARGQSDPGPAARAGLGNGPQSGKIGGGQRTGAPVRRIGRCRVVDRRRPAGALARDEQERAATADSCSGFRVQVALSVLGTEASSP